jgi:hypothetical protein
MFQKGAASASAAVVHSVRRPSMISSRQNPSIMAKQASNRLEDTFITKENPVTSLGVIDRNAQLSTELTDDHQGEFSGDGGYYSLEDRSDSTWHEASLSEKHEDHVSDEEIYGNDALDSLIDEDEQIRDNMTIDMPSDFKETDEPML